MIVKKKWILGTAVAVAAIINIAALSTDESQEQYKNLQVLPKDIDSKDLQGIMVDQFQDGLGVGCGYCHAREKNSIRLDYASDEKPEKKVARMMMRMTLEINKTHFGLENALIGDAAIVTCFTCHRATPHPESQ